MFRETLIKHPGSSVHPEPALSEAKDDNLK
jgi:hypothetical protein